MVKQVGNVPRKSYKRRFALVRIMAPMISLKRHLELPVGAGDTPMYSRLSRSKDSGYDDCTCRRRFRDSLAVEPATLAKNQRRAAVAATTNHFVGFPHDKPRIGLTHLFVPGSRP